MTCEALSEIVTEYLEGAMSGADRARFERHVALCPACRRYLEQMQKVVATLGRLPPEPIPAAVEAQLLERFRDWKRARNSR
jgi:anti-sigma factor RsiW